MTRIEPSTFRTEAQRWEALERRDDRADGAFFYGVRTTGVFCRPTCRSRRPNRANVDFFDDIEGAEGAGFRACKRCRPEVSSEEPRHSQIVARACSMIEGSTEIPSLEELASAVGL